MSFLIHEFEALLHPLGLLWAAAWVALGFAWRRKARKSAALAFAMIAWLSLACSTQVAAWFLARLERPFAASIQAPLPAADAIVMLGGSHTFTPRSIVPINFGEQSDRMVTAAELWRRGQAPVLVLGGGRYRTNGTLHADSELMEGWLRNWGVSTGRVEHLGMCSSTRDEAVRSAALAQKLGWKRVIVVSSAFHLRRGVAAFRQVGLEVIPFGCDFTGLDVLESEFEWTLVPRGVALPWWAAVIHEEIGWWYYRWKGWI